MLKVSTRSVVANFLLFQIGWLVCVLSGAYGYPWFGIAIAALIVGWHVLRARQSLPEVKLILLAMLIGLLWDSLLVWQGWLIFSSGVLLPFMAPVWIIMMWAMFATTLNVSLRWLHGRYWASMLLGAVGGPLAYYAGQQLHAVRFSSDYWVLLVLGIGWAGITPLLMYLSRKYDGYRLATVMAR